MKKNLTERDCCVRGHSPHRQRPQAGPVRHPARLRRSAPPKASWKQKIDADFKGRKR